MEKLCWFIKGLCGPQNNIIFFQILWKSKCHILDFHVKRWILDFLHLFHSWKNTTKQLFSSQLSKITMVFPIQAFLSSYNQMKIEKKGLRFFLPRYYFKVSYTIWNHGFYMLCRFHISLIPLSIILLILKIVYALHLEGLYT